MMGYGRVLFFSCMCLFIFKRELKASSTNQCYVDSDCGENAICDTSVINSNVCVCKPGFFDKPPAINALSEGCPGECDEFGKTDQCEGNTLCTQTPQGYGLCTCPENSYGPPQCLGECDEFGKTDQCKGNTLCTQTPQGYGVCTCPKNTYGPPECLGECDEFGKTDQCDGNTLCTQTPQGYGVCTCPENTYGPPECLGSATSEKFRRTLILVYGALSIPLLLLVPAALASGLNLG